MICQTCKIEMTAQKSETGGAIFCCLQCGATQTPQLPKKRFTCNDCGEKLEVAAAQCSVAENGEMSCVVVLHPPPTVCKCGSVYLDAVDVSEMRIPTRPRQVVQGERRIVLPGEKVM